MYSSSSRPMFNEKRKRAGQKIFPFCLMKGKRKNVNPNGAHRRWGSWEEKDEKICMKTSIVVDSCEIGEDPVRLTRWKRHDKEMKKQKEWEKNQRMKQRDCSTAKILKWREKSGKVQGHRCITVCIHRWILFLMMWTCVFFSITFPYTHKKIWFLFIRGFVFNDSN